MKDLFLISGTNKKDLKSLGLAEDKIRLFQENDPVKNNPIQFIITDDHQAHLNFKQLSTEYPKFNIHWLKGETEKMIWQQSHGSLICLKQYLEKGVNNTEKYSENDLLNNKKNVIIISETSGMGKSTVLTFLAQEIKKQTPESMVFKIDLNMYTEQLDTLKKNGGLKGRDIKETFEKAIQFLGKSVFKIDDSSKLFLFQFYCQHNIGNMIVMLDGFDEISPYYKDEVIELVQALRNGPIKQIWITTRPNMQRELEKEFQQFAHALKPFSKEDQLKFLTEFWKKSLNLCDEINKDKVKTYAVALIKLLGKSISDKELSFTGIPLQTRMLAEAFKNDFYRFYKSNETVPNLPENLDLIYLYERLLKHKHQIYQKEKNGLDLTKSGIKRQYEETYCKFLKDHEIMALHTIFNEEEFEQHFHKKKGKLYALMNDIKEAKYNCGLIDSVINCKAQFIHRTFAEYLVAKYLVASLENQTLVEFVLQRILIRSSYQVIRVFFNRLLTEISSQVRMSECALKTYGEQIKKLWLKNKNNLYNEEGNTFLHVAAEEDNENIARFLLKSLEKHDNDLKFSIMKAQNKVTNRNDSALYLAAEKGHLKISKCLVDNGDCVNWTNKYGLTVLHMATKSGNLELVKYLVEKGADINTRDFYIESVLFQVAQSGNFELVKYFVEKGADINVKTHCYGEMVLHKVFESGNLELVKYLVEKGADINVENHYGETVLHKAFESDNLELVKYLVKKGADVSAKNNKGETVLHDAFESGNLELVKYLVEEGADINVKNSYGLTVLHLAAKSGDLEFVKYLVENGAHINAEYKYRRTVLHNAVTSGNLEIVKYLVEKGIDVNTKDKYNYTVLHVAVESGNLEIVKYLVEKNADINVKDNPTGVVLQMAARSGNLEIVKYLVEKNADVNVKDNTGEMVLQMAARSGNLELVKYFVEKGADMNAKDKYRRTVLYNAARSGNLEIVKYFIEKGLDMNTKDKCRRTVLHNAARSGTLEIVKYLVEKGADMNAKDKNRRTALYNAAYSRNLEIVKYLVEKGVDVNVKDNTGEMVLHIAAESDKFEFVKYLVEKGADINAKDKYRRTALYNAANSGNSEIVKYLVEKGVDVNVQNNKGVSVLHIAAKSDNFEFVKYLVEKGADINAKDKYRRTVLHDAVKSDNLEIVKYLVEKGVDVNAQNNKGETVLQWATKFRRLTVVKYLKLKGPQENSKKNGCVVS